MIALSAAQRVESLGCMRRYVVFVDSTKRAQTLIAISAIVHWLLLALGMAPGSRVRPQVVPLLKRCACGAATRSSTPLFCFPQNINCFLVKKNSRLFLQRLLFFGLYLKVSSSIVLEN